MAKARLEEVTGPDYNWCQGKRQTPWVLEKPLRCFHVTLRLDIPQFTIDDAEPTSVLYSQHFIGVKHTPQSSLLFPNGGS